MSPIQSLNNFPDRLTRDSIVRGECLSLSVATLVAGANLSNLRVGQPRPRRGFSVAIALFVLSVIRIVLMASLKQVRRITTTSPVACMADVPSGPPSIAEEERKTMRATRVAQGAESPITVASNGASPTPTFSLWPMAGGLINVAPETLNFLCGKLRRVYIDLSHGMTSETGCEWSGSFAVQPAFGPSAF